MWKKWMALVLLLLATGCISTPVGDNNPTGNPNATEGNSSGTESISGSPSAEVKILSVNEVDEVIRGEYGNSIQSSAESVVVSVENTGDVPFEPNLTVLTKPDSENPLILRENDRRIGANQPEAVAVEGGYNASVPVESNEREEITIGLDGDAVASGAFSFVLEVRLSHNGELLSKDTSTVTPPERSPPPQENQQEDDVQRPTTREPSEPREPSRQPRQRGYEIRR